MLMLVKCISNELSGFTYGKEYEVKRVSYSGGSLTIIDDNNEWHDIGRAFFEVLDDSGYQEQLDEEIREIRTLHEIDS